MKKILFGIALLVCAACRQPAPNTYTIEGTAQGLDGKKVYVGEKKEGETIMYDSAEVKDGKFRMENLLTGIKRLSVFVDKTSQPFLLDENPIEVTYQIETKEFKGKKIPMPVLKITGDKDQELYAIMNKALVREMYSMLTISFMGNGKDVNAPENKQLADSIGVIFTSAKEATKHVFDSIVDNHKDSYVSAIILNDFFAKERSVMEMQGKYDALSERVKSSNVGQTLKSTLDVMIAVGEGQEAPDFTLNDPDGHPVALSSLRGKCVLVDFWASWCAPCLREAPNVKKVYDKYHDKGFEVLSVSIDEKKDAWLKAIEKHQLNWLHVSSLQGWKCPVAKLYHVTGVPAMFLIDKEGRIVSTNARGEALEQAVDKLLNI